MDKKTKSSPFLKNSALFIISTIIVLLFAEATLRIIGKKPLYVNPEQRIFWKYDASLGWAHRPGQQGIFEKLQFRTHVRINQKGLRDREHPYKRQENTKRILVLGDSITWGFGVEEDNRFTELLETSLGAEVINAGVSGYSTDQELLWFESEGIKYNADLVILEVCGNDVPANHLPRAYFIYNKPRFEIQNKNLTLKDTHVPKVSLHLSLAHLLRQRSAFFHLFYGKLLPYYYAYTSKTKVQTTHSKRPSNYTSRKPFELTIALINKIMHIAELNGAQFLFVGVGSNTWWSRKPGKSYESFIGALRSTSELSNIVYVDSVQEGFNPESMTSNRSQS